MSVGIGAILVVESKRDGRACCPSASSSYYADADASQIFIDAPLVFAEMFGQSLVEHMIERFMRVEAGGASVEETSVLIHEDLFDSAPALRNAFHNVRIEAADDTWARAALTLRRYADCGIEYAFIAGASCYTEADLANLLQIHCERGATMTRAGDAEGPLDLWVVNCDAIGPFQKSSADAFADGLYSLPSDCVLNGYSKRINSPGDFRQLAVDAFLARCQMRPSGREIYPGIWAEEDANVSRDARIVAPAYLGHGTTVCAHTLIQHCSNVERSSFVDCGTTIDDTSVLPNSYIGISLDVRHALVNGNKLLNLERDVVVEITDPNLFRSTAPEVKESRGTLSLINLLSRSNGKQLPEEEDVPLQESGCFAKSIPAVNTTTEFES